MKALVVDDSNTMRRILSNILKDVGFEDVQEANDGKEAVAKVGEADYNLVLMDWNMPVMSGIEALTEIRSQGHKVPIVMVTTEAEKSRVMEALKAGANNYIIKPFSSDKVAEKIATLV